MEPMLIERYTIKEYLHWEGDWELIAGVPYAMAPAPVGKHQWIMMRIGAFLNSALEECEKCFVVGEAEWRIAEDTVVRPDVMVMCGELVNYFSDTPRIIFEIISPSSKLRDEIMKKELYRQMKVPYYALVYPDEERVLFYRLENGQFKEAEAKFRICDKDIKLNEDYIFRR